MQFYLAVLDDKVKTSQENPSIGIIVCKDKNKTVVEYALHESNKPIGVASWEQKISQSLPENMVSALPSIEELEHELHHLIGGDTHE